jgi:hypothetical protein
MSITMVTKSQDTRIRDEHTTFGDIVQLVPAGKIVSGIEKWVAPADGNEVKKGDVWLLVTAINGVPIPVPGWMAYIHKGIEICDNFAEDAGIPSIVKREFEVDTLTGKVRIDGGPWQ